MMSDQELSKYIPVYGDRLAAVAFCRRTHTSSDPGTSKKEHLLERIRAKICNPESKAAKRTGTLTGNKNAKRKERRIEIGWINFVEKENRFKQVRAVKGGGTRHLTVDKNTTVGEIQEMAKSLFFPDGASKDLSLKDHECSICDFSEKEVENDCTVEDLYLKSRVKILRLYLSTKHRAVTTPEVTKSVLHDVSQSGESDALNSVDLSQEKKSDPLVCFDLTHAKELEPLLTIDLSLLPEEGIILPDDILNLPIHEDVNDIDEQKKEDIDQQKKEDTRTKQLNSEMITESNNPEPQGKNEDDISGTQREEALPNPYNDGEVSVGLGGGVEAPVEPHSDLDDTLDWDGSKPVVIVVIRRGYCLTDLMTAFLDPDIIRKDVHIKRKLPNGKLEEGEGSGVLRDCLSEFWEEFYNKCTEGTQVKTPFLRHEYQIPEWQAIARILVVGWTSARYFPLLLPLPFLEEALYGTVFSSVTDSFLHYVSAEEKNVLQLALDSFESVDQEELMDVLDTHGCHYIASKDTVAALISQLGHKTLIQTPMFVIECWRPILKTIAHSLYPQKLLDVVEESVPTPKRVKAILKFPVQMNAVQNTAARHLRRFIGESDITTLKAFLRFCTGADILFGQHISVEFIETSDFQCRPQAHTCGCLLKLPLNYQSYPDLRNDFNLILKSSIWIMDVV